jgi:hypothetical protein
MHRVGPTHQIWVDLVVVILARVSRVSAQKITIKNSGPLMTTVAPSSLVGPCVGYVWHVLWLCGNVGEVMHPPKSMVLGHGPKS